MAAMGPSGDTYRTIKLCIEDKECYKQLNHEGLDWDHIWLLIE